MDSLFFARENLPRGCRLSRRSFFFHGGAGRFFGIDSEFFLQIHCLCGVLYKPSPISPGATPKEKAQQIIAALWILKTFNLISSGSAVVVTGPEDIREEIIDWLEKAGNAAGINWQHACNTQIKPVPILR